RIGRDELRHHDFWANQTGKMVGVNGLMVWLYVFLARLFGLTFSLKLMERGEDFARKQYERMRDIEGVDAILKDEEEHEKELIDMLADEPLEYAGSIVLGLNDALVELTGALAGLTLALGNAHLVAVAGLVTGIAASLSMATSEYLSSKSEAIDTDTKSPAKAAVYTGTAYILAVVFLILPFFLLANMFVALATTLVIAVLIIAVFNFYISVAKELRFWPRFVEMAGISLGVAAISFGAGWALQAVLGVHT
ncbi:MAG: VIT1/CCC1 transporter family protein, partial [Acidobacteria bacterium]|nr:VIT1/CCC1 transporter family protein [Acidobacteriota bacterium]